MKVVVSKDTDGVDLATAETPNGKRFLRADAAFVRVSDGLPVINASGKPMRDNFTPEESAMIASFPRVQAAQGVTKETLTKLEAKIKTLNSKIVECADLQKKATELATRESELAAREGQVRDLLKAAKEQQCAADVLLADAKSKHHAADQEIERAHALAAKVDVANRVLLNS